MPTTTSSTNSSNVLDASISHLSGDSSVHGGSAASASALSKFSGPLVMIDQSKGLQDRFTNQLTQVEIPSPSAESLTENAYTEAQSTLQILQQEPERLSSISNLLGEIGNSQRTPKMSPDQAQQLSQMVFKSDTFQKLQEQGLAPQLDQADQSQLAQTLVDMCTTLADARSQESESAAQPESQAGVSNEKTLKSDAQTVSHDKNGAHGEETESAVSTVLNGAAAAAAAEESPVSPEAQLASAVEQEVLTELDSNSDTNASSQGVDVSSNVSVNASPENLESAASLLSANSSKGTEDLADVENLRGQMSTQNEEQTSVISPSILNSAAQSVVSKGITDANQVKTARLKAGANSNSTANSSSSASVSSLGSSQFGASDSVFTWLSQWSTFSAAQMEFNVANSSITLQSQSILATQYLSTIQNTCAQDQAAQEQASYTASIAATEKAAHEAKKMHTIFTAIKIVSYVLIAASACTGVGGLVMAGVGFGLSWMMSQPWAQKGMDGIVLGMEYVMRGISMAVSGGHDKPSLQSEYWSALSLALMAGLIVGVGATALCSAAIMKLGAWALEAGFRMYVGAAIAEVGSEVAVDASTVAADSVQQNLVEQTEVNANAFRASAPELQGIRDAADAGVAAGQSANVQSSASLLSDQTDDVMRQGVDSAQNAQSSAVRNASNSSQDAAAVQNKRQFTDEAVEQSRMRQEKVDNFKENSQAFMKKYGVPPTLREAANALQIMASITEGGLGVAHSYYQYVMGKYQAIAQAHMAEMTRIQGLQSMTQQCVSQTFSTLQALLNGMSTGLSNTCQALGVTLSVVQNWKQPGAN